MKQPLLSFLALTAAVPALAQDTVITTGQGATRGTARAQSATTNEPDWFSKTINIDFKNATLEDAIKKILEAAKVKFEKIDDQTKGNKSKLSLKIDDVNARDAMASISRLYGAQAFILNEDGKTTVELRKRTTEPTVRTLGSSFAPFPNFGATGFGPGSAYVLGTPERYKDLPTTKLDIEIKDGTVLDIIKQICEKAGLEYEIEDGLKSNVQVKITMKGISVGNALDNAAGWLDCGWKAEKKGDKIKIAFSKKHPGPGFNFRMGTGRTGQVFSTAAPSVPFLNDLPIVGNLFRSATLPSKRVSLDKKNTDVRECFKEILKDADLSYALADDLPTDAKSFTFSNVPLSTALDMICESIEVGWVSESGPDGKPVIRIGKRYKGRSTTRSSSNLSSSTTPRPRRIPIDFLLQ